VQLRNNALTLQMSGEQVRLQVPPKLHRVHSWITLIIRQWVCVCEVLLVRHCNLGPVLYCFGDIAGFCAHDPTPIPP